MKTAEDLAPQLEASIEQAREAKALALVKERRNDELASAVVVRGDLSGLSEAQLKVYYTELCHSLDLNPATQPFSLLTLNGKKMFYANKSCSDQLRKRDNVSVTIVSREQMDDLLVVTARATLPNGRTDESVGALPLGKLQGEARANAIMKCETKAKRRVTLSICGLGMLDESEVEAAMAAPYQLANPRSMHALPGESPDQEAKESAEFDSIMKTLREAERALFDPGCDWETMNKWRQVIGNKAKGINSELRARLSALYLSDDVSPAQRDEMSKLYARVDRKCAALEAKIPAPALEDSFTDEPDGTEAFEPTREPGSDDD